MIGYGLGREDLDRVFPFHFVIGPDDRVVDAGRSLRRIAPTLVGAPAAAHLRLRRATAPLSYASMRANRGRLQILDLPGGVVLRGEFIEVEAGVIFLGSPWVVDRADLPRLGLSLADFAPHDPMVDTMQVVDTLTTAQTDLRELTSELERRLLQLRTAEARHREILATSPDGIVSCDGSGRVISANPTAELMFGDREAKLRGRPITDFIPTFPERTDHGLGPHGRFPCEVVVGVSTIDGQTVRTLFIRDRTEHVRAEAARRAGEQRYRGLVESLPDVVFELDTSGRIRFLNPAWEALTSFPVAAAAGRPLAEFVASEDRAALTAAIAEASASPAASRLRVTLRLPNSPPRALELVLRAPEAFDGLIGVATDVTAEAEAEQALIEARDAAQHAARAKADFLANMSHEIRTPMNAVIGMTSLLLDTTLSAEQQDYVDTIRSSGEGLLALINEILDFSKIEAGRMELEVARFDLVEMIESAMDLSALFAARKGLAFAYELGPDVPAEVAGDATRLRQILVNLLSNAIKFTTEGSVTLRVQVLPNPSALTLEFAVRDTGIGIRPDAIDRLFHSFSQVDHSTTRMFGGTGLGLAISQRLAGLMGGSIAVESEHGRGSTFTATVDVTRLAGPPAWRGRSPALDGKLAVVADHAADARAITAAILREWGARVIEADELAAAEAAVAAAPALMVISFEDDELDRLLAAPGADAALAVIVAPPSRRVRWEAALTAATRRGQRCLTAPTPLRWQRVLDAIASGLDGAPRHIVDRPAQASSTPTTDLSGVRILVAEDNVVNQKVALGLLGRLGCRADVVANGVEALDAVQRQAYDLVFLDIQMPEMDGLTTARSMNELFAADTLPYLCAMTANATRQDREAAIAAGMHDFISKPVTPGELSRVVELIAQRTSAATVIDPGDDTTTVTPSNGADPAMARRLDELCRDAGVDVVRDLAAIFLEDAGQLVARVQAALGAGDAAATARAAHALRGAAANIGAAALAELAGEVERAAKTAQHGDAARRHDRLDEVLRTTRAALTHYVTTTAEA